MLWFEGSIAEAVSQSKEKNAIFVVFVEGEDELSTELSATLQQDAVARRLADAERFLAIKLSSASESYTHFAQIYQFVPVPSLFFIGHNGTPLEVVCGGIDASKLSERIDRILQEHYKDTPSSLSSPSSSMAVTPASTASRTFIEAESQPPAPAAPPRTATTAGTDVAPKGDVTPPTADVPPSKAVIPPSKVNVPPEADTPTPKTDVPSPKDAVPPPNTDVTPPKTDVPPPKADVPPATVNVTPKVDIPSPKTDVPSSIASQPETPAALAENSEAAVQNASSPGETPTTAVKVEPEYEVVCDGDVCVRRPKSSSGPHPAGPSTDQMVVGSSPPEPPALDDRVERAKELIEMKRLKKAEEEKELQRQKELERRSMGQGVAEMKRWQADQELKQAAEERRREKAENTAARQRILEQIAQDRAERRAREAPSPPPPAAATPTTPAAAASGEGGSPTQARIQFKLADGSSHVAQFSADSTLSALHDYVAANVQPSGTFTLWTAFPRRALAATDETLRSLGLAPSAALLVLPTSGSPPTAGPPAALPDVVTRIYECKDGSVAGPSAPTNTKPTVNAAGPSGPQKRKIMPENNDHIYARKWPRSSNRMYPQRNNWMPPPRYNRMPPPRYNCMYPQMPNRMYPQMPNRMCPQMNNRMYPQINNRMYPPMHNRMYPRNNNKQFKKYRKSPRIMIDARHSVIVYREDGIGIDGPMGPLIKRKLIDLIGKEIVTGQPGSKLVFNHARMHMGAGLFLITGRNDEAKRWALGQEFGEVCGHRLRVIGADRIKATIWLQGPAMFHAEDPMFWIQKQNEFEKGLRMGEWMVVSKRVTNGGTLLCVCFPDGVEQFVQLMNNRLHYQAATVWVNLLNQRIRMHTNKVWQNNNTDPVFKFDVDKF